MLNFSEWDKKYYSIDESAEETVLNWLSRTFGGKVKKIDSILADLTFLEKEYSTQWEKDHSLIYDLKGQIETGELSPSEEKDLGNKIKEAKERISSASRKKVQQIRSFNDQAMKIVEGNPRAHKYWDLKKAEAEVEIIKNFYEISKKFPDKKLEDSLYSDYKKSYDSLKQKERGVEKISDEIEKKEKTESEKSETSNILALIRMSLSEFKTEIKGYSSSQLKSVHRSLIDRKNLALNDLRTLRRTKSKEMDQATSKEKSKIMSKYNPKIYDLGEFIDKIREKINHING
jgi:hypothetical protein